MGSLNICRALHRKETEIRQKLQELGLDVLFLLETDVKNLDVKKPPIYEGYSTICPLKNTKETTRILAIAKQTLKVKKREDLMSKEISSIWIEVTSERAEKFLVGGFYREFDDLEGTEESKLMGCQTIRLQKFIEQLERAENEKCTIIGIGDLNLDSKKWHLSDYKYKKLSKLFQDTLDRLGMKLWDYGYTFHRIDEHGKVTKSAIDHAFSNNETKIKKTDQEVCSFTDHNLITIETSMNKNVKKPIIKKRVRDLRMIRNHPERFVNALRSIKWETLAICNDVDEQVQFYTSEIMNILNLLAPKKEKVMKNMPKINLSKETKEQLIRRDSLKERIMTMEEGKKDPELKKEYTRLKNKCRKMVYREKIEKVNARIIARGKKEVWKVTNNYLQPAEVEEKMEVIADGVLTSDEQKIANEFVNYYIKKVTDLSDGIDKKLAINPTKLLQEEQRAKNIKKLIFKPVQEAKVYRLIKDLKAKTSFGTDDISAELLKLGGEILCVPLTYIINRSIVTGKFPTQWKEAIIKPLFKKKGSKEDVANYRPVALLCVSGMILERVITEQLEAHLEEHNLMGQFQFGYRKKRSTITAVATMSANAEVESANGKVIGMTMFDMSAAFDTVKKSTLCEKLKHLAISKNGIQWIESYMNGRKQKVKVGEKESELKDIMYGTPQGSRLSPLLFNIMMCDLNLYLQNGLQGNFADDTSNEVTGEDAATVRRKLEEDAGKMLQFTSSNNLFINPGKTAFICNSKDIEQIKVGPNMIERVDHTDLLGMTMSGDLSWNQHAEVTKKKLKQRIGILRRLKYNIPQSTMRIIAEAIFTSKLRGGIALYCKPRITYSEPSNSILKELTRIQNDMMRAITMTKHGERKSIKFLREKTKTTSVNHLTCYHILMEAFNIIAFNSSEHIKELLMKKTGSRSGTRSEGKNLATIPINRGSKNNGFLFYAATLWCTIPQGLRDLAKSKEFADEANALTLSDKEVRLRQAASKKAQAEKFKKNIKVWINKNIPSQ